MRRLPPRLRRPGLVGPVGILRPLQLHFEPLHADLEAVHGLDGSLGAARVVEAHEACGGGGGSTGVTPLDATEDRMRKSTSVCGGDGIRIVQLTATQIRHEWHLPIIAHLQHNIHKQDITYNLFCFPKLLQRKYTKTKYNIPRKMTPSAFKLVPC